MALSLQVPEKVRAASSEDQLSVLNSTA